MDGQALLREVVLPEAKRRGMRRRVLILDNATTPAPTHLEGWGQAEAVRQGHPLAIQICGLPKTASWLDHGEIWFSRLHRTLLQPNHVARGAALEQAILEFIACSNRTARPIKWTYTVEKLEQKLGIHL